MYRRFSFFAAALFSIALLSTVPAQEQVTRSGGLARVNSMGENYYIEDPLDLKTNPAYGSVYRNFLWGDLGGTKTAWGNDGTSQYIGANFGLTDALTLGVILARSDQASELSITSTDFYYLGYDSQILGLTPNNNTEIFASYKMGSLSFGLGASYIGAKNKFTDEFNDANDAERSFSQLGFNAGLIWDLSNRNKLEAAVSMMFPSLDVETKNITQEMSQTVLMTNFRGFITINSKVQLVPALNMIFASGSYDVSGNGITSSTSDLPSHFSMFAGCGVNYRTTDFLLAGGPCMRISSVKDSKSDPELEDSETSIGWNLGAEYYCTNWLTARVGYKALTNSTTDQSISNGKIAENTQTTFGSNEGFTLGLGFHFGSFALDATVDDDVLRQGLNNIGGGHPTLGYLSMSYAF